MTSSFFFLVDRPGQKGKLGAAAMTMRWMAAALLAAVLLLAAGQGRCSAAAADENAQEVSVVVVNHQGSDHKDSFPW